MGKGEDGKVGEEGLSAPINAGKTGDRDSSGRFTPGHSIKGGRPTKAKELATLSAVTSAIPPERVVAIIEQLINHPTSWRAQQAGLELHLAYTLGKPVQRIQQSEGGISDILDELGE